LQALVSVQPGGVEPLASAVKAHPVVGLQLSAVHGLPSLQTSGFPGWQVPSESQVSAPLQTLPSEQEVPKATGLWKQAPLAQPSAVQTLPSSQLGGVVAPHEPFEQTAGLQKSPEQEVPFAAFALWTQPVPVWQLSTVQMLPSSQLGAVPAVQVPFWQAAGAHGSAEHEMPLATLTKEHPVTGSQLSAVHGLWSSQTIAPIAVHCPLMSHMPMVAQAFCGVHMAPISAACWQPIVASQLSLVHALLSLQLSGAPGWQMPEPLQVSWPLQTVLSSHEVPATRFVWVHGFVPSGAAALHVSCVHGLASLQLGAMPA
jgi:hypothetical protein